MTTFAANPNELFELATVQMRNVASSYARTSQLFGAAQAKGFDPNTVTAINKALPVTKGMFSHKNAESGLGPAFAEWCNMRDDIHRVIAGSGENLLAAAHALVLAAGAFGYQDDENATKLRHSLGGKGIDPAPALDSPELKIVPAPPRD